jgi:hypothetical protein
MTKKTKRRSKSKADYRGMPPHPIEGQVTDRRAQFRTLTRSAPVDRASERAFLASKLTMLRTYPGLTQRERAEGEAMLVRVFGTKAKKKTPPIPGGVGYGMFYTDEFRTAFARGTSFSYEIVCPNPPGGNIDTSLYLTATNRAHKGVEAFVAYQGQNDTRFKVFDWARHRPRSRRWPVDILFAELTPYLGSTIAHDCELQTLLVWNSSVEIGTNQWRNEVLLRNRATDQWDLIYRFDYPSTTVKQQRGFVGSWGPIVETFQSHYSNTALLGFLNTKLSALNARGQWSDWDMLSESHSTIQNDSRGFSPLFIDPNYSLVVKS